MKRFLQVMELAVKILPMVVVAVRTIEDAAPVPGQGTSKAEVLRSMVAAAHEAAGDDFPPLASVLSMVDKLTGSVVILLKRCGIFAA